MKSSQYELSLLVNNKPIREYSHEESVFVEGRAGSEYKIRIKNNTGTRTCFIVSVDGLSVLNGKQCSNDSPGYVLGPLETLDIACYKVDDATGAKFIFGDKGKSYSVTIGQGEDNVGVVGAMVFREVYKPAYIPPYIPRPQPFRPWHDDQYRPRRYGSVLKSIGASSLGDVGQLYSAELYSTNNSGGSSNVNKSRIGASIQSSTLYATNTMAPISDAEIEKLGTVFGEAMQWKTETVTFAREANAAASLVIFYDTKKNLERRGVKVEHKVPPLPNAFPANAGCPLPDNWQK